MTTFRITVLLFLSLLVVRAEAFAQSSSASVPTRSSVRTDTLHRLPSPRGVLPGRGLLLKSYADSTEFNAAFAETYQLIKPKESMQERAAHQFASIYPRYKNRGVDSMAAWKSVVKSLDTTHDRQVLFQAYRTLFNAEEMRTYTTFLKTSAGKKMYEAQIPLAKTSNEMQGYISRMVMSTIMPMAKGADPQPPHAPMPPAVINTPPSSH